jgi:hypothetical protein
MDIQLRNYCIERFVETFSSNIPHKPERCTLLTQQDYKDLIEEANDFAIKIGVPKLTDERWICYMTMIEFMVSSRNIKSKMMYVGVIALNNLTFLWDDLSDDIVERNLALGIEEAKRITEKYYEPQHHDLVFNATKQWVHYDTRIRRMNTKKLLFGSSVDTYWKFRLIDSGTNYFILVSAPIYKDDFYLELAKMMIPSHVNLVGYMFVNDVVSFNREKQQKEVANCLYFSDYTNKDKFINEFFNNHIRQIVECINIAKSLPDTSRDILLDSVYGHFLWAKDTIRYDIGGVNPINALIV